MERQRARWARTLAILALWLQCWYFLNWKTTTQGSLGWEEVTRWGGIIESGSRRISSSLKSVSLFARKARRESYVSFIRSSLPYIVASYIYSSNTSTPRSTTDDQISTEIAKKAFQLGMGMRIRVVESKSLKVGKSLKIGKNRIKSKNRNSFSIRLF